MGAAVLAAALPMQFCEHAAVPLSMALQNAGASGGLAFATLATMPAINMASLGVVAHLAGMAAAVRVACTLWLCGFVGSFIADAAGIRLSIVGHGDSLLPEWYEHSSRFVMGAVMVFALMRLTRRSLFSATTTSSCCEAAGCKAD